MAFGALGAALVLATAACGSSTSAKSSDGGSSSGGLETITVGYKQIGDYAPLVAGVDKGFFKDAGLNVKLISSAGSASADMSLIVNGQEDIAIGSTIPVEIAASKGIPVQFLTGWNEDVDGPNGTDYQVVATAKSGIKSFSDLAGHKVGVDALDDGFDLYTKAAVTKAGGDSSKVTSVEVPFANQVQAFKSGEVDAIATEAPYSTEAIAAGGVAVGDPMVGALGKNPSTKASFVNSNWLKSHGQEAKEFIAGLNKSFQWANANPTQLQEEIAKLTSESLASVKKLPLSKFSSTVNTKFVGEDLDILMNAKLISTKPSMDALAAKVG